MSLLEVKNLQVRVEEREILHGLSLTVNPGEVHAIMGPNGSGKSTLSHVIAGKPGYEVTGGEILFKGENLLRRERIFDAGFPEESPRGRSLAEHPAGHAAPWR
jgi:Fe-S cluster assembly ATP-binding protein